MLHRILRHGIRIATALVIVLSANNPASAICVMGMGSCDATEADGKRVLEETLILSPNTIQSFRKTDWKDMGTNEYLMEFIAVMKTDGLKCREGSCLPRSWMTFDAASRTVKIHGLLYFTKWSGGWRGKVWVH